MLEQQKARIEQQQLKIEQQEARLEQQQEKIERQAVELKRQDEKIMQQENEIRKRTGKSGVGAGGRDGVRNEGRADFDADAKKREEKKAGDQEHDDGLIEKWKDFIKS